MSENIQHQPCNPQPQSLARLAVTLKRGDEQFHAASAALAFSLLDFWRWSVSDLVSNATRGILAEFIVAKSLGIPTDSVRDEWGAFDLSTPAGIKVEVKSAAYLQTWHQRRFSEIKFLTPKTRGWDPETNLLGAASKRHADV